MGRLIVFPGESEMAGGGCDILWLPFKGLHEQQVASPATSKDILPSLPAQLALDAGSASDQLSVLLECRPPAETCTLGAQGVGNTWETVASVQTCKTVR